MNPYVRRMTSFADRLKARRLALGMTQETLATKTGLSFNMISRYERGKVATPRGDALFALAEALETTADDLFSSEPPRPAQVDEIDGPHEEVLVYLDAHPGIDADEAEHLCAFFKKTAPNEDVRDLVKAAHEKYRLRKLLGAPAPAPVGTRRKLGERDAEIAARRSKV